MAFQINPGGWSVRYDLGVGSLFRLELQQEARWRVADPTEEQGPWDHRVRLSLPLPLAIEQPTCCFLSPSRESPPSPLQRMVSPSAGTGGAILPGGRAETVPRVQVSALPLTSHCGMLDTKGLHFSMPWFLQL